MIASLIPFHRQGSFSSGKHLGADAEAEPRGVAVEGGQGDGGGGEDGGGHRGGQGGPVQQEPVAR